MSNLNEMTLKQLKAAAKAAGHKGYSKMKADELITLLTPEGETASGEEDLVGPGGGLRIEKDREEQNGIKRPSIGGKCRAVWDALDAFLAETGEQPTSKTVKALAEDEGWNPNNASIEFYQWRKFNGITGRQPAASADA